MDPATISIRPAAEGDAAAIAKVHVQAWRETYQGLLPAEELANLSESDRAAMWTKILAQKNTAESHLFGAWLDGRLLGFVNGGMARGEVENADSEFYAIYVLQAAQRQQVGRLLFRALTWQLFTSDIGACSCGSCKEIQVQDFMNGWAGAWARRGIRTHRRLKQRIFDNPDRQGWPRRRESNLSGRPGIQSGLGPY